MSRKTTTLILIVFAFLLLYLSSAALTGIPAVVCMCAAIALTGTALVRTIQEFKR